MGKSQKYFIGLLVAVVSLVTGISYAYFSATFSNLGDRETSITAATMGSLKLTASEATYTSGSQYPGDMAIQKFAVEPIQVGKGVYELDLTGVLPSAFGSDIEIQLYKSIDTTEVTIRDGELTQTGSNFSRVDTLITNGLTPVYTGSLKNGLNILYQEDFEVINDAGTLKVRENSTSESYSKYTFYLVYNYKNNGNQNAQMGSTFGGTISGKLILHKTTAAEEVLALAGDADSTLTDIIDNGSDASGCTSTLAYDDYGNLRYVGANPCNYVTFNDETWRIIGVFDNQLKMVRSQSIGNYSWDTSQSGVNSSFGINQWGESGEYTGADLMKLLNPGYEDNLDNTSIFYQSDYSYYDDGDKIVNNSLYWNRGSGICYNNLQNVYTSCDFSATGLKESSKSIIDYHLWNIGSPGSTDVFTGDNGLTRKFYEYERSSNFGCSTCTALSNRTATWNGYVGLIYISDYGYAVGGADRSTCLSSQSYLIDEFSSSNCAANNWLKLGSSIWTLSPYNDVDVHQENMLFIANTYSPSVKYMQPYTAYSIYPSVYLISSAEFLGGNGSTTNPYTLKVN
ncbi:MAG: hypothetical protein IJ743_01995 [Bacilli bacterium]|nr:hypothetical protein [Bacilli bacterium]